MNQFSHVSHKLEFAPRSPAVSARLRSMATLLVATAIPATSLLLTNTCEARVSMASPMQDTLDAKSVEEYRAMLRQRLSQLTTLRRLPEVTSDPSVSALMKSEFERILQLLKSNPLRCTSSEYDDLGRAIEEASTSYAKAFEDVQPADDAAVQALKQIREQLKQLRARYSHVALPTDERETLRSQIVELETKLAQSPLSAYTIVNVQIPNELFESSAIFHDLTSPTSRRGTLNTTRMPSTGIDEVMNQMARTLAGLQSMAEITRSNFLPDVSIAGPAWEVAEAKKLLETKADEIARRVSDVRREAFMNSQRETLDRQRHLASEVESRLITIDWKGGTLAELLNTCRGTRMNVVLAGGVATANAIIPSLSVRDVEPSVFFRALATTPLEDGRWLRVVVTEPTPMKSGSEGGNQRALGEAEVAAAERALPIITIAIDSTESDHAGGGAVAAPSIGTDVYDISAYLKANPGSMEKINDAISTALELSGGIEEIRVRLHEPTGLLFVRGPITQRKAVSQVVQFFTR